MEVLTAGWCIGIGKIGDDSRSGIRTGGEHGNGK